LLRGPQFVDDKESAAETFQQQKEENACPGG